MPTYEYECEKCGLRSERRQAITETPLAECPKCQGRIHRLLSGGAGFILNASGHGTISRHEGACSLERTGRTCCGRDERCGQSLCGGEP